MLAPALANPAVVFGLQVLKFFARDELLALELLHCSDLGLDRALKHLLQSRLAIRLLRRLETIRLYLLHTLDPLVDHGA